MCRLCVPYGSGLRTAILNKILWRTGNQCNCRSSRSLLTRCHDYVHCLLSAAAAARDSDVDVAMSNVVYRQPSTTVSTPAVDSEDDDDDKDDYNDDNDYANDTKTTRSPPLIAQVYSVLNDASVQC